MDYRFLGPFEVHRNDEQLALGGHRQRAVLAVLALAANRPVSTGELIEQLWAGDAPPSATATVQAYVSALRRILEPDRPPRSPAELLVSTANGYLLVVPDGATDAGRFFAAHDEARTSLAAHDAVAAGQAARRALAEWRGPALADFVDEPFAQIDIARFEEARLQTMELGFEADLAAGHHLDVVADLGTLVAEHPLRERLRGQLMLALYRSGRQAEALEVAGIGRRLLAEELGLDPDPELQQLEGAILRQDPSLVPAPFVEEPPREQIVSPVTGASETGLVGRTEERDVLARALTAAGGGTGRVVLIGGEPGIGKTRLAESFAADVPAARVHWGRSHETEGAPPLWPWRQVLRSLAADLDPDEIRLALGSDTGVVLDVAPELAPLLDGVPTPAVVDAETARFHFFDAVARLLDEASRRRPLVVVLEDLHWADEASMALLRFVVSTIRRTGLLIVATYRSVAVADSALLTGTLGALAREPVVERILLPGLSADEGGALIADLLGGSAEPNLVAEILDRTGGNPLFIIHLTQLLRGSSDAAAIVRNQIPPEVIDLIGLRVGEQSEPTRRLLEVAAVVGRSFDLSVLVAVGDTSFDAAVTCMDAAVRAGLVAEEDAPGSYRFTHALMREAIIAGLGRARVGRLHGLVGDAIATRGADPGSLSALAHHYWEAAAVGWADAAFTALTAAGAAAASGLAYEDSERHLQRALQLVAARPGGTDRDRAELSVRMQLSSLFMRTHGYAVAEVAESCRRARELALAVPAPAELLVASWGLAAHHLVRSEHRAAIAIGTELLAAGETEDDPVATLAGHLTTGVPSVYLGEYEEGARHLEAAIGLNQALDPDVLARFPQDLEVGAIAFLALASWFLGDAERAEDLRRAAIAQAGRRGGYDEVFVLMVSAQLGVVRRSPEQVLEDTNRMLVLCGEADFRHLTAHAHVMRGWSLAVAGEPEAGVSSIEEGIAYFDAHERSTRRTHNLTLLAEALEHAGREQDARAAIEVAMAECPATEERFYEHETRRVHERLVGGTS